MRGMQRRIAGGIPSFVRFSIVTARAGSRDMRPAAFHREMCLLPAGCRRRSPAPSWRTPMRYTLVTTALLAALMVGNTAAFAQEPTEELCRNVDAQVGSALENTSSTNRDQALRERNSGRS